MSYNPYPIKCCKDGSAKDYGIAGSKLGSKMDEATNIIDLGKRSILYILSPIKEKMKTCKVRIIVGP